MENQVDIHGSWGGDRDLYGLNRVIRFRSSRNSHIRST